MLKEANRIQLDDYDKFTLSWDDFNDLLIENMDSIKNLSFNEDDEIDENIENVEETPTDNKKITYETINIMEMWGEIMVNTAIPPHFFWYEMTMKQAYYIYQSIENKQKRMGKKLESNHFYHVRHI